MKPTTNPSHFGETEQRLYGVYHVPDPSTSTDIGVVVCQPLFHEDPNSRRAMRGLADLLAQAGIHALRFDYSGTGDSDGESDAQSVDRWIADVGVALDELKAARGVTSIGIAGLRFGATLAALAGARRGDIDFVTLWEPIVDGAAWLAELRQLHERFLTYEAINQPDVRRHSTAVEAVGYSLSRELAAELGATSLARIPARPARRVLLVDEGAGDAAEALRQQLEHLGAEVDHRRLDGGHVWMREVGIEQAQVPRAALDAIVAWSSRCGS